MTLKTIFRKPVDRPIEGVIKADDEAGLRVEIEEYVITNEVEKRLESFLDAYNNYAGANGVWVSGFFGSGKSHLLKMLALLMENRAVDGKPVLDMFLPKCGDNEILRGDLQRAVSIPARSILFNIDQKADVISKTEIDALLAVFMKVFDEMCGYYGKQGHIAQFERDLDSRGIYDRFKTAYETVAKKTWQRGREQSLLEAKSIARAYAQVTSGNDTEAQGILDKYRKEYRVSIEDFADKVNAYIESEPSPHFRLNFFVDEVGQYIAENVKLMTNLQTIAESLATKCRGRAWVIVTAQEDMDNVVGEMGDRQGNDFSKIQARFANRMKLTSKNVAEVIQKRLLLKTEAGTSSLSVVYDAQSNNFKTLFDFADGCQTYRNYQDREHFIASYPFVPYQFDLFKSAIENLSQHSAFEGKHSSVGERSMLGVFQQVVISIGDREVGQLATFDLMFEGIRTALKSNIQRAIIQAEKNLDGDLAIRLLKALFLVKYVKEFKATLRNLCILVLSGFDRDLPEQRQQVEEALRLLEQQSYLQRNGELYEYLTDDEKDVEQEIKGTDVEQSSVSDELEKIIFDYGIKQKKIRYDAAGNTGNSAGQDYAFAKKLDNRLYGREYELAIDVISPFHEHAGNDEILRMQGMGRDTLVVVLPLDDRLLRDLYMYKRTEKYVQQNISVTQQDAVKRILTDKKFQNQERYSEIQKRVQSLLGKARLFVEGSEIEVGSADGQTRVVKGFHELILRTYPNLRMLRGANFTEKDIANYLKQTGQGLLGNDATTLEESEQEQLAFINSNSRMGVRTTLKSLVERFEKKPYGWSYAAALCILAKLWARGKVEARSNGNVLEGDDLARALGNSNAHGNVLLEPQVEFTAAQVRALKKFYEEFFDRPPQASEAKALGQETGTAFGEMMRELEKLAAQVGQYPFLKVLTPAVEKLKELAGKPYGWYLTDLSRQEDALFDLKEGVIDPICKFMNGPQQGIFDGARRFVQQQQPNFDRIAGGEAGQLVALLADPDCFRGDRMQRVKVLVEGLEQQVAAQIALEVDRARAAVAGLQGRLGGMVEFGGLSGEQQAQINQRFEDFAIVIANQSLIAVIRDSLRQFEEEDYQRLLAQVTEWAQPVVPESVEKSVVAKEPPIAYVSSRSVRVEFAQAWLADEADVDRYVDAMRSALLAEIRQGKRVQI
jgi:hypothetical protein